MPKRNTRRATVIARLTQLNRRLDEPWTAPDDGDDQDIWTELLASQVQIGNASTRGASV